MKDVFALWEESPEKTVAIQRLTFIKPKTLTIYKKRCDQHNDVLYQHHIN